MRSFAHPSRACALALSLVLCALVAPAHAEDIDIYSNPNANSDMPNVLFVLDDQLAELSSTNSTFGTSFAAFGLA